MQGLMKIKRKQIAIVIFLMMSIFLCYNIIVKIKQREKENDFVQTMPGFSFQSITGQIINASNVQSSTLIVFFNSECEGCIDLTNKIVMDTIFVTNNHVIMVSTENIENLLHFKTKMKIDLNKIDVCSCNYQTFAHLFGNHLMYPSFFYYNANKKLIRKGKEWSNLKEIYQVAN